MENPKSAKSGIVYFNYIESLCPVLGSSLLYPNFPWLQKLCTRKPSGAII